MAQRNESLPATTRCTATPSGSPRPPQLDHFLAAAEVLAAAKQYALRTSFCCNTDATGVSVQPLKGDMKKKQPCRRGHFFVQLFDKAHAFFEYVPRETSDAVKSLMAGYTGYVQADAKSVYDILYRGDDDEDDVCVEVGCWAHYPETRFIWS